MSGLIGQVGVRSGLVGFITDISSDFTLASDINVNDSAIQAYKFNGFVFLTAGLYHDGDMSNNDLIATIGSSVNYPATNTVIVSLGHGGDYAHFVKADANGSLRIIHPYNVGANTYYINFHFTFIFPFYL